MAWETKGQQHRFVGAHGFIVLCPLRSHRQVRPEVVMPTSAPVWLVQNLFVEEERRGQGHGLALLEEAFSALPGIAGGAAWLGLYSDNVRYRRKSSQAARDSWEALQAAHPGLTTEGGFVLIGE